MKLYYYSLPNRSSYHLIAANSIEEAKKDIEYQWLVKKYEEKLNLAPSEIQEMPNDMLWGLLRIDDPAIRKNYTITYQISPKT